jgi:hypothetical protein
MDRIRFISHNGKQLLFLDFSSCKADEALKTISEAKKIIQDQPENSLLILTDVTDGRFNTLVTDAMKEFVAHNKPYVKASAVVGITGLKKIIYDAVLIFSKRNISTFDSVEAAKEWLSQN